MPGSSTLKHPSTRVAVLGDLPAEVWLVRVKSVAEGVLQSSVRALLEDGATT